MDLNVDMGESFGRYILGNDAEVMKYITSANIACGYHAGDPMVMAKTVMLAKENNVAVGAHVGLPDKQGFGRRRINITKDELRNDILYQVGALDAFLKVNNMKLQHVKPHGILYRMIEDEDIYAEALLEVVGSYNPDLYIFTERGTVLWEKGIKNGFKMLSEVFIDLDYDDNGKWVLERVKKAKSPEEVAERAVLVATEKKIKTITGKFINVEADTMCCHGDAPNAVEIVKKVKEEFDKRNISLKNFL